MSRIKLSAKRQMANRELNIGHIIIFCEGKTEKYYFEYFTSIIENKKYTDIKIVLESANGDAQSVLNYANKFMADENNIKKYSNYEKYLVFDCDAPKNIQSVIAVAQNYELLISNYLFEIWLLMHFEDVTSMLRKSEIYRKLETYLNNANRPTSSYKKGHRGITRAIIENGDIEKAIDNAKALVAKYENQGIGINSDIKSMNPYSSVYKIIEKFMVAISTSN